METAPAFGTCWLTSNACPSPPVAKGVPVNAVRAAEFSLGVNLRRKRLDWQREPIGGAGLAIG